MRKIWEFTVTGIVLGIVMGWLLSLISGDYFVILMIGTIGTLVGLILGFLHRNNPQPIRRYTTIHTASGVPEKKASKISLRQKTTIADVLLTSILSGLAVLFVVVIVAGGFYIFEPHSKYFLKAHFLRFLIVFSLLFIAGFGLSLAITLGSHFRRGKWG